MATTWQNTFLVFCPTNLFLFFFSTHFSLILSLKLFFYLVFMFRFTLESFCLSLSSFLSLLTVTLFQWFSSFKYTVTTTNDCIWLTDTSIANAVQQSNPITTFSTSPCEHFSHRLKFSFSSSVHWFLSRFRHLPLYISLPLCLSCSSSLEIKNPLYYYKDFFLVPDF